ncbi:MAG: YeeE/YedE family protein [Chloroflexi bacterium]|nr:YeeE/YedE family protein [Chloroflexota bacterium]
MSERSCLSSGRARTLAIPLYSAISLRSVLRISAGLIPALAIYLYVVKLQPPLAVFWLFGLAFGFVLQRSRFCFASSFRDIFLLKDGRVLKAIIIGMAIATLGFGLVMYNLVPNISREIFPVNAYVTPLGFHTVLAGIIFGLGMVMAGGCFSGTLYRLGEGYVASLATLVGILGGMGLLLHSWNWWWQNYISFQPRIWLPHFLGWTGAILVTLTLLLLFYLAVLWWESRGGVTARRPLTEQPLVTFGDQVRSLWRTAFVLPWPVVWGGVMLGILNVFEYLFERPWGLTGEVSRWSSGLLGLIRLSPGPIAAGAGPCAVGEASPDLLTWGLMINGGMILGSALAALLASEFKPRFPRQRRRYAQSLIGGALMGYGAGLASGCTIGAFFSAVPSLGLNGWVFGGGLAIGAYLGGKLIQRI